MYAGLFFPQILAIFDFEKDSYVTNVFHYRFADPSVFTLGYNISDEW